MDFNQVRYYLALADTLNFTRAAEQCHVTQPALTQAIKRLESELGGQLIHRNGSDTELTTLGRSLRGHFEEIDRTRHLLRSTARAVAAGDMAELHLGVMCTVGPRLLADLLVRFQQQHPMVSLVLHDVTPKSIPEMLMSGAVDAVFCAHSGSRDTRLHYIELFTEQVVVAFPAKHAFLDLEKVPLAAIAREPYLDRLHCEFREDYLHFCEVQGLQPNIVLRSQREDWIQSLIRDGAGVSVIPRYSLLAPELDFRPIEANGMFRRVELAVVERGEPAAALAMFTEHARSHHWPSAVTN